MWGKLGHLAVVFNGFLYGLFSLYVGAFDFDFVDKAIYHLSCDLLTTTRFVATAAGIEYLEGVFSRGGLYGAITNSCC